MTLRVRLFAALLLLALVPMGVVALFALAQLDRATDRWFRPGVENALESALEVSRGSLTRLQATTVERTDAWASTPGLLPLDAGGRAALRDGLRQAGLDFAHVYARARGRWRRSAVIVPSGVLAADTLDFSDELDAGLAGSRVLRSPHGALAAVARAGDGEALVTGVRLAPDFWRQLSDVGEARELYGRLSVLVDVQRRYVELLVAALVALVTVAALAVTALLARQMTRPLAAVAEGFGRVAAGDLAARVPERGARELRTLAAAFNAMTARLGDARSALARAEREAAWREVARHLAHEIKNPLTPMRLSLHRLQRRVDLVPEEQRAAARDALGALLQEVEHLTRLAEQFSQYARLPEPRSESFDLTEVVRSCAALHEPEGLTVVVHAPAPLPVRGDRLLLARAVHNLLLNACEASAPGGTIEVRAERDGAEARLEVLDRGPGIAPEIAGRLFEPYVSTKQRGSGLGLSLIRDVAAQHHGRVTLENREGGGARARLVLPLDATPEHDGSS